MFKTTTVNHYLRHWGYDHETLRRQPAAGPLSSRTQQRLLAIRFTFSGVEDKLC